MDQAPSPPTPPDSPLERIKADRDYELKTKELEIKEKELFARVDEIKLKQKESSLWRSPVLYTAAAAALGVYANLYTSYQGSQTQIALEAQKSQGSLILQMLSTGGDPDKAAKNLELLVQTDLIRDQAQKKSILAYLASRKPGEGAALGSSPAQSATTGFYGADTRRRIDQFPAAESNVLGAKYGYVGILSRDGSAFCNAVLVGPDLAITARYCLPEPKSNVQFAIYDKKQVLQTANMKEIVSTKIVRDPTETRGEQGIALIRLDKSLGEAVGWVQKFAAKAVSGSALDIVAIDARAKGEFQSRASISGAATNDPNCSVLHAAPALGFFAHRCVSPHGSGGAPTFVASTGELLGLVARYDQSLNADFGYVASGVLEIIATAQRK